MIDTKELIGKQFHTPINKDALFTIKEIKQLNNIYIAYYGEQGIINLELCREPNGNYLYTKPETAEKEA